MHKMRLKTQLILGAILLIVAFSGIKIPVSSTSALSPLNIGAPMPVRAASIPPQTETFARALPIVDCSTCHDTMVMKAPEVITPENDLTVLPQSHTDAIVQCVFCHAENPEMNISQMGEPE